MKVDFSRTLKALDGSDLTEDGSDVILGQVCIGALMGVMNEEHADGQAKFSRYLLAERLFKGGVVEVTAEEISLLKERIGQGYSPAVVGPAYRLLEGQETA